MRTIEELKSMTHEDLIRLVQELEEKHEQDDSLCKYLTKKISTMEQSINDLKDVIKKISNLI